MRSLKSSSDAVGLPNIARITDTVAANGDSRAVGVLLLWADLADDQGVGDLI